MRSTGPSGLAGMARSRSGLAGAGVVQTREPETGAVAFDGNVLVDEDGRAVCGQGPGDCCGIEGDVVVAEDGVAMRSGEGREDFGAAMDGMTSGDEGERTVGDEVAGQEDQIGGEGVDFAGRCARGRRAR